MGGAKKPTTAKQNTGNAKESKKSKKDKGESGPKKAEIVVMVNEQQAMKIIQNSKVITVQDLARQTGVKISAANAFLKESAEKGTVKRIGGYSGHHLYQAISS
jgi:small subunit ribosomal protein S25e